MLIGAACLMTGCIISDTDFFGENTVAPFETLSISNKYLVRNPKNSKTYLLYEEGLYGKINFSGELALANVSLVTKDYNIVNGIPKNILLFRVKYHDSDDNNSDFKSHHKLFEYGIAFFDNDKKKGYMTDNENQIGRIAKINNIDLDKVCTGKDKDAQIRCVKENIEHIYSDVSVQNDLYLKLKSFSAYKRVTLDIIKSHLKEPSQITHAIAINKDLSSKIPSVHKNLEKNEKANNLDNVLKDVSKSLDDRISKLDEEIQNSSGELARVNKQILDNAKKKFDIYISIYKHQFTNESNIALKKSCFQWYHLLVKDFALQQKQISLENQYYGYGNRKAPQDFYAYVHNYFKNGKLAKNQCGFWFADEIGKEPNALEYALADFAAYHNLNVEDKQSAEMIGLIYYIGRGMNRDEKLAKYWFQQAKIRGASVDVYLK